MTLLASIPARGPEVMWENDSSYTTRVMEMLKRTPRWVCVTGFPLTEDDRLLESFAGRFGSRSGEVYNVEVRGEDYRDEAGMLLYSTAPAAFPCHTDGSNREQPYDLVLLLCVRADPDGGESIIVPLEEILPRLSAETDRRLRRPVFPFDFGFAPILTGRDAQARIRHNRQDVEHHALHRGIHLSSEDVAAIDELDAVIDDLAPVSTFKLRPGDCLLMGNHRMLHGRTAVSPKSRRLLKRIRLYTPQREP